MTNRQKNGKHLAANSGMYKFHKANIGLENIWQELGKPCIIEYRENNHIKTGFFIGLIYSGQYKGDFLICSTCGTLKRIDLMQFVDLNQLP